MAGGCPPSKGTPGPFPVRVIRAALSDCCATFPRGVVLLAPSRLQHLAKAGPGWCWVCCALGVAGQGRAAACCLGAAVLSWWPALGQAVRLIQPGACARSSSMHCPALVARLCATRGCRAAWAGLVLGVLRPWSGWPAGGRWFGCGMLELRQSKTGEQGRTGEQTGEQIAIFWRFSLEKTNPAAPTIF